MGTLLNSSGVLEYQLSIKYKLSRQDVHWRYRCFISCEITGAQGNWQNRAQRKAGTAQGLNEISEHYPNALFIDLSL